MCTTLLTHVPSHTYTYLPVFASPTRTQSGPNISLQSLILCTSSWTAPPSFSWNFLYPSLKCKSRHPYLTSGKMKGINHIILELETIVIAKMWIYSLGNSLKYIWKITMFSLYFLYFATFSAISFGGIIDMALYNSTLSPYLPPSKVHTDKLLNWNVRVLFTILFSLVEEFIWWQFVCGNFQPIRNDHLMT